MKTNEKIITNYFQRNSKNITLECFLDYVYFIMFSSYIKKTFSETKKKYFIKEKIVRDTTACIDSVEMLLYDTVNPEQDIRNDIESNIEDYRLFKVMKGLSEKQKLVIYGYYVYNQSEIEISRDLKITRQAVNRIRNRALNYLHRVWG